MDFGYDGVMGLKIEALPIDTLIPDPTNARKHSDENLQAIAQSLKQFGQRKPIVITADDIVVAGNGTMQAAKGLGWDVIDTVRVPADWSTAKVKAFALADNRVAELAEWDADVLMAQAGELTADGFQLEDFGFTDVDLGVFDVQEVQPPELDSGDKGDVEQITFQLHTEQADLVRQAIASARSNEDIDSELNSNSNGNAIAFICGWYTDGRV